MNPKKAIPVITPFLFTAALTLSASAQEASPSLSNDETCPNNCFCYQAEDHPAYTICADAFTGLRGDITYTNSAGQRVTLEASYFSRGHLWNLQDDVIENPFTVSRVCFDTVENCLSNDHSAEGRAFFASAQEKWNELFTAEDIGQRYMEFAQRQRAEQFDEEQLE
ncbi:MAG: hypothetical protein Q8R53_02850 [Nanoarchaeota archaeon]|nr:hypothetical protein [Nanoarchaeota archaeon]